MKCCKKQRTTSIIISALSDGSSHYLFTDLRPELFQQGRWRKNLVQKAAPLPLKRSPRSTREGSNPHFSHWCRGRALTAKNEVVSAGWLMPKGSVV
jgi:hypothetical protein